MKRFSKQSIPIWISYLLIHFMLSSIHKRKILQSSCWACYETLRNYKRLTNYKTLRKYKSLLWNTKKFQIIQHPRLMANFIQFWSPAAPDHCKQAILRTGKIHSTGVCILNKIHWSKQRMERGNHSILWKEQAWYILKKRRIKMTKKWNYNHIWKSI